MTWVFYSDVARFAADSRAALMVHEAANGLLLGLTRILLNDPEARDFHAAILKMDSNATGVALQRKGANLVLSSCPEATLKDLAKALHQRRAELPGVVGPARTSEKFAEIWTAASGRRAVLGMDQKILRLRKLREGNRVAGKMRLAKPEEVDLIASWFDEFSAEALPHETSDSDRHRRMAEKRVFAREISVWEADGQPVSMAGIAGPTENGIRVNAVFTPAAHRRHGYATALVAELSRHQLAQGKKFLSLYTDAGNPTSNHIYQTIGYELVGDSRHYVFV